MFSFLRSDWSSRNMQGKIVVYLYWNVRIVGFYHSFGDSLKVETKITKLLRNVDKFLIFNFNIKQIQADSL